MMINNKIRFFLILLMVLTQNAKPFAQPNPHPTPDRTFKICQNKHCVKRYSPGNLVEVMENLVETSNINIESSGCLSNCDHGPNMVLETKKKKGEEKVFNRVDDHHTAASILEQSCDLEVPTMLIAACTVMGKAISAKSFKKKEKCLNSVISALSKEGQDPDLSMSHALVSALLLRAEYRSDFSSFPSEEKISNNTDILDSAEKDCRRAIQIESQNAMAYRLLADMLESKGDILGAIDAVTKSAQLDSSFFAKAKKELDRLGYKM